MEDKQHQVAELLTHTLQVKLPYQAASESFQVALEPFQVVAFTYQPYLGLGKPFPEPFAASAEVVVAKQLVLSQAFPAKLGATLFTMVVLLPNSLVYSCILNSNSSKYNTCTKDKR